MFEGFNNIVGSISQPALRVADSYDRMQFWGQCRKERTIFDKYVNFLCERRWSEGILVTLFVCGA